jgi:hypothetical protein
MRPLRRQRRVQARKRAFGERGEGHAVLGGAVRGHDAGAAAVGKDRETLAFQVRLRGEDARGGEELGVSLDAQRAAAPQRGLEHRVAAHQRAGVARGGARAARVAADLEGDHRLDARRGAQGGDEAPRVADALDVQQDRVGRGIGDQEIEHLAEIHVGRGAQRYHAAEADPGAVRPVEDRGADGARLRHEREPARQRRHRREGGVEPGVGAHQAETVGAEQAHSAALRLGEQPGLEPAPGLAGFGKAAGKDRRGAHTGRARLRDDLRDALRRRNDDGEIRRPRQVAQPRVAGNAVQLPVFGVDRGQRATQLARGQVAPDQPPERALALGRADQCNARRGEQGGEGVAAHGGHHSMEADLAVFDQGQ